MSGEARSWRDALRDLDARTHECVHCGLCLPSCPTHALLGTEMDSPRGRIYLIRAMSEGRIDASATTLRHLDRCLDCRACETACPSGVRYGEIIEGARAVLRPRRRWSVGSRLLGSTGMWMLRHRGALAVMAQALGLLTTAGVARLVARALPPALGHGLALAPKRRGAAFLRHQDLQVPAVPPVRGRVGLFVGCIMNELQGDVHRATARVLARLGYDVVVPRGQGCCGALHAHNGERTLASRLRAESARAFSGLEEVVVNSAGCGAHLAEGGGEPSDPRFIDFSLFCARESQGGTLAGNEPPGGEAKIRAVFDEPCHLLHAQRIAREPRELLSRVPGLELLPLEESDWCCGAAGVYNLTQRDLAGRLLDRKVENIAASGAELVVTANPGCAIQLEAGLRSRRLPTEVLQLPEVLDRWGLGAAGGSPGP
ncbi:MAG: (Fe-S)-binding protein [Candidatus Eisenbacteria bacterium]